MGERRTFRIRSCDNDLDDEFIGPWFRDWDLVDRGVEFRGWMDDCLLHFTSFGDTSLRLDLGSC